MSETQKPAPSREALLKSIDSKLTWGVIMLFIIMLNTCSVSDDVEDAIRDARRDATRDAVAPAAAVPAPVSKEAP